MNLPVLSGPTVVLIGTGFLLIALGALLVLATVKFPLITCPYPGCGQRFSGAHRPMVKHFEEHNADPHA